MRHDAESLTFELADFLVGLVDLGIADVSVRDVARIGGSPDSLQELRKLVRETATVVLFHLCVAIDEGRDIRGEGTALSLSIGQQRFPTPHRLLHEALAEVAMNPGK
ncbi:MAG: hypothetical protein IPM64_13770 [Phycisphaerales bacterium]|nr:hypothetical protein [Phycisphaerales bacterium]